MTSMLLSLRHPTRILVTQPSLVVVWYSPDPGHDIITPAALSAANTIVQCIMFSINIVTMFRMTNNVLYFFLSTPRHFLLVALYPSFISHSVIATTSYSHHFVVVQSIVGTPSHLLPPNARLWSNIIPLWLCLLLHLMILATFSKLYFFCLLLMVVSGFLPTLPSQVNDPAQSSQCIFLCFIRQFNFVYLDEINKYK